MAELFAAVPTADIAVGRPWWEERFFAREPDLIPNANEAAWRVTSSGWVYVIGDPERAGKALITLLVDDFDAFLAGLAERGVELGELNTMPGGMRTVSLTDPEGNTIQLGG